MKAKPRAAGRRKPPTLDARSRILDAALDEFATRGFEAASTNAIARVAGVAKGLVFHYFGSKEDLYLALIDLTTSRIVEQTFAIGPMPADLFERLAAIAVQKTRVLQREPLAYQLLMATTDAPASLQARLEQRRLATQVATWPRFLEGVDASQLRPGITLEQAMETLVILGLGIERKYMAQLSARSDRGLPQIEDLAPQLWTHFERLRDGIYAAPLRGRKR